MGWAAQGFTQVSLVSSARRRRLRQILHCLRCVRQQRAYKSLNWAFWTRVARPGDAHPVQSQSSTGVRDARHSLEREKQSSADHTLSLENTNSQSSSGKVHNP
eukprot:1689368-Amphidinium_carterae.2